MALQNPSPFSKIFVHNLSRAFRNLLDQEAVVAKLRANGVTLVSATENIGGDDETGGSLVRQMLGIANEMKSNDARVGTMRGMTGTAREGFSPGARTPLGYRSVDAAQIGHKRKRKWEIDPVEAAIVRLMYDLASLGDGEKGPMGIAAITDHLNAKGHRTRDGNLFGVGTVHEVLHANHTRA